MDEVKIIEIKKSVFADNDKDAEELRKELKNKGYIQMATMDAGSDNPGIIMSHPESGCEMEIRLHASLLTDKGFSIIVANHQNNTAIVMQDSESDENKSLLRKFLE